MGKQSNLPWYDTFEGIVQSLKDLGALNHLRLARHDAGYLRGERLHDYIILGRFYTDSCGNFSTLAKPPKAFFPNLPAVLSISEFWEYLKKLGHEKFQLIQNLSDPTLPTSWVVCQCCGKPWDISNCHDYVVKTEEEIYPLDSYIGNSLDKVRQVEENKQGFFTRLNLAIKNAKTINDHNGWLTEHDGINYDYIIQEGDAVSLTYSKYYHQRCAKEKLFAETKKSFSLVLENSGFYLYDLIPIRNEYCDCEFDTSWFLAKTDFGLIKIGWRKRVINIDIEGIITHDLNLAQIFETEDVTKCENAIHAWSFEKAQEYLTKIREELKKEIVLTPF